MRINYNLERIFFGINTPCLVVEEVSQPRVFENLRTDLPASEH